MNGLVKWVAGTALAAGTVAALLVPKFDDADPNRLRDRGDTLNVNYISARERLMMLRRIVARGEAREIARGVTGVRAGEPFFRVGTGVSKATGDGVIARARAELDAVKGLPTKYPVAVLVQLDTTLAVGGLYTQSTVLPEKPGDPCTVLLRVPRSRELTWFGVSNQRVTSTCAFYAAYGQPGTGTQQWLTETRGISARWVLAPPFYQEWESEPRSFRISSNGWSPVVEATLRCRLEILEACEELVGPAATNQPFFESYFADTIDRSALRTEYPGVDVTNSYGWWEDRRIRGGALGSLAQELGTERFGAIWRDERGFRAAYASQAGRPFAAWVADYVAVRVEAHPRGPGIPMFAVVVALALFAAGAIMSARWSPRSMV